MAKRQYPEFQVQTTFVSLMRTYYPDVLMFAIPNGGKRGIRDAKRFKAMGVRAGVFDIFVAEPNSVYAGYFIEFKAPGRTAKADPNQVEFGELASERHYATAVHNDAVEALVSVEEYLGIPQNKRIGPRLHLAA